MRTKKWWKRFLIDALLIMVCVWIIITLGAWIQTGKFPIVSSEDLPILIGVYLFAGVVCGLSLSAVINYFRK